MEIRVYKNGGCEEVLKLEKNFRKKTPRRLQGFSNTIQYNTIQYNGGSVTDGHLYVKELDEDMPMGYFFGINIKEGSADIIEINEEYDDDIPKKSLLIGAERRKRIYIAR